ncbi:SCO3374 family protein [Streptomyces ziwulingensis]|uniref:SCO3374 family protein n=1 Tax=Streptomyces ziwulingensis TaxID=1045501 RepID=A0ABP9DA26_9ACTN
MVGASPAGDPGPAAASATSAASAVVVPGPRRPPESAPDGPWGRVRRWYEHALGWETEPGVPVRLRTGVRFDVLDLPAPAGHASLGRLGHGFPVALRGDRMLLLVAPGSAEELPGLLEWLEWGSLPLDLVALGAGGLVDAPLPGGAPGPQGAAVWLRPPEPGCEVEDSLPTLSALGSGAVAPGLAPGAGRGTAPGSVRESVPDLVRVVGTVATQCHRLRLWPAGCARR